MTFRFDFDFGSHICRVGSLAFCAALLVGCGGSPASPVPGEQQRGVATKAPAQSSPADSANSSANSASDVAQNTKADGRDAKPGNGERKWIGDIPYDVWFDDPLAVAADTGQTAGVSSETKSSAPDDATAMQSTSAAAERTAVDWQSLITRAVIETEVKRNRAALTGSLQTVGRYNQSYKELQIDSTTMSALAAILLETSYDVSWRDKAAVIRELATEITDNSTKPGREVYSQVQVAFEKIVTLLDGGQPAELPDAPAKRDFVETAAKADLMRRMEVAFKWLKGNVGNKEVVTAEVEKLEHEVRLLLAFGVMISDNSYGSTDEKDYQRFAKSMNDASKAIVEAAQQHDYEKFSRSIAVVQKACDECHATYRFADGLGF